MSHLRLTTSDEPLDPLPVQPARDDATGNESSADPDPGAVRFAAFTPMNDQPGLADRKATFVIGACGLLLSTMLLFVIPLSQFAGREFSSGMALGLTFALSCVSLLAIRIAYRCYTLAVPPRPNNPLFFQNIAAREMAAYQAALESATGRGALHDVLDFNYMMARLGAAKYRLAGQALLCLRVAIPLWVLLLTVIAVREAR